VPDKDEIELPECDGYYMMINIIARRARDINKQRNMRKMYDEDLADPLDVALNEYENGLLSWDFRKDEQGLEDYRSAS